MRTAMLFLYVLISLPLFANAKDAVKFISFAELVKNVKSYDGKEIRTEGYITLLFENMTLTYRDCPKNLVEAQLPHELWIELGNRELIRKPTDKYVHVVATVHSKDKTYGHLGMFPASLTITEIKNLPTPEVTSCIMPSKKKVQ